MIRNVLAGIAAGAAGTTALNVVSYLDMAVHARAASSTPAETVRRTEQLLGVRLSSEELGSEGVAHRRSAAGALLGIAAGLGVGVLYGLVAPRLGGASLVARGIGTGLVANVGTTGPMVVLGITDPRTWPVSSWLSDLVPHLAFGLATAAVWEMAAPRR
ncbi:hypothetical protein LZ318_40075 [Saccharopolyspora indica]|uniref:hypothetical protein n=1 Tax=Saccharopolyspora indica TaxID=1229659 RepID=UPI0022EB97EB|nr:hypothetical protein [Saccharopolyspora indica]MDA3650192.1 hypothetical protein [Saccharopolyspora indica]